MSQTHSEVVEALLQIEDTERWKPRVDAHLVATYADGEVPNDEQHDDCVQHVLNAADESRPETQWRRPMVGFALRTVLLLLRAQEDEPTVQGRGTRSGWSWSAVGIFITKLTGWVVFLVTAATTAYGVFSFLGWVITRLELPLLYNADVTIAVRWVAGFAVGMLVSTSIHRVKRLVSHHRFERRAPLSTLEALAVTFRSSRLLRILGWRRKLDAEPDAAEGGRQLSYQREDAARTVRPGVLAILVLALMVVLDGYTNFTGATNVLAVERDRGNQLKVPVAEIQQRVEEARETYNAEFARNLGKRTRERIDEILTAEAQGTSETGLAGRGPVYFAKEALLRAELGASERLAGMEGDLPKELRKVLARSPARKRRMDAEVERLAQEMTVEVGRLLKEIDSRVSHLSTGLDATKLQEELDGIVSTETAPLTQLHHRHETFKRNLAELVTDYEVAMSQFAKVAAEHGNYPVSGESPKVEVPDFRIDNTEIKLDRLQVREGFSLLLEIFKAEGPAVGWFFGILAFLLAILFSYADLVVAALFRLQETWQDDWERYEANLAFRKAFTDTTVSTLVQELNRPGHPWMSWNTVHPIPLLVVREAVWDGVEELVGELRREDRDQPRWTEVGLTVRGQRANLEHRLTVAVFQHPRGMDKILRKLLIGLLGGDPFDRDRKRAPVARELKRNLDRALGLRRLDELEEEKEALEKVVANPDKPDPGDQAVVDLVRKFDAVWLLHQAQDDDVAKGARRLGTEVLHSLGGRSPAPGTARYGLPSEPAAPASGGRWGIGGVVGRARHAP